MEKQTIINYKISEDVQYVAVPNVYEFKTKHKIVEFLIKVLVKLKVISTYQQGRITYKAVEIKYDKVYELIEHLFRELYSSNFSTPRKIILGREQMQKLGTEMYEKANFMIPLEINGRDGMKYRNVEIEINPRIDGVVLI